MTLFNSVQTINNNSWNHLTEGGSPRGVMVKSLDCGIVVSEFELQSHYDVHTSTYTHRQTRTTDKMKRSFFQAVVVSILLYGCTTWTLTKRLEKKLDGNYTRMLRAILNKSWRSRDQLTSDVLLWTPTYGQAKAGRPARTCIQQLCEDTGCSPEDLPEAMNDSEKWRERVRDIHAGGTTWWWW